MIVMEVFRFKKEVDKDWFTNKVIDKGILLN